MPSFLRNKLNSTNAPIAGQSRVWAALAVAVLGAASGLLAWSRGAPEPPAGTSVADLVAAQPDRADRLLGALDLDRPGMEGVRRALESQGVTAAGEALLAYYADLSTDRSPRPPGQREEANSSQSRWLVKQASAALSDSVLSMYLWDRLPRRDDGGWRWEYTGPKDDSEFARGVNRHGWLSWLADAYAITGDERFAAKADSLVRDWVLSSPYPRRNVRSPQWRTLEAAGRMYHWPAGFYQLQAAESFSPATRLLMLSSLLDHAHSLRSFHRDEGNWVAAEMTGLATIAAYWPEFDQADEWFSYASDVMLAEVEEQVDSEGVQKELSSTYHRVTAGHVDRYVDAARRYGDESTVERFEAIATKMWDYLAETMRPDGTSPVNNDADKFDIRGRLLAAADRYNRTRWRYIATNGSDSPPSFKASPWTIYQEAGHAVYRTGYDRDATWLFFDAGPWGMAHQHNDALHLSLSAFGRDLLVDGGRYTYTDKPWRDYFKSSFAHNTIIVDGKEQNGGDAVLEVSTTTHSRVEVSQLRLTGTFTSGYRGVEGQVVHTRQIGFATRDRLVVVDHLQTDRPRRVDVLWHLGADCRVAAEGNDTLTKNERGNVRITPVGEVKWRMAHRRGSTKPIQGWYSPRLNHKVENTCAVYSTEITGEAVFAWVIYVSEAPSDPLSAGMRLLDNEAVVSGSLPIGGHWRYPFPLPKPSR